MRALTSSLLAEQKKPLRDSLWKAVLTDNSNSYTYDRDRIIRLKHREDEDRQTAELVLDDSDKVLSALDLEGFKAVLSYGMKTPVGDEYSATAPLWVISQTQLSQESGKLLCHLGLGGIMFLLSKDKASEKYTLEDDDTQTVKTLFTAVADASLAPFDHCTAYTVIYDSEDTLIDSFKPRDYFVINRGESRLTVLKKLIGMTGCVMRAESDGNIHVRVPTITGTTYDSEYELAHDDAGKHTLFSKELRKRLIIPSYIDVRSHDTHTPSYDGHASFSQKLEFREYLTYRLESDAQATAIAEAKLERVKRDYERGAGKVPMNVGAEVYDYNLITDVRAGDTRTGNVRGLTREIGDGDFDLSFRFGRVAEIPITLMTLDETGSSQIADMISLFQQQMDMLWERDGELYDLILGIVSYLEERRLEIERMLSGERAVYFYVIADEITLTTGDAKMIFTVPPILNGMNLVDADAMVYIAATSGTPTIQIANVNIGDMLSTPITIDRNEDNSYTAAIQPVIDTDKDHVATGDVLRIDVDVAGTGTKGLQVCLTFKLP